MAGDRRPPRGISVVGTVKGERNGCVGREGLATGNVLGRCCDKRSLCLFLPIYMLVLLSLVFIIYNLD